MSWKRSLLESALAGYAAVAAPRRAIATPPRAVFVLRNNDLGDVLTTTPLFEALKRLWPGTRVIAGVGPWAVPLLAHNPHVDEILPVSAPWHNKFMAGHPSNSIPGLLASLRYIRTSQEVAAVRERQCDVGIDVLGSPPGALLLLRAGIPRRVGVRGYAGGHAACTDFIEFHGQEYVGRSALRQAGALGLPEANWPAPRPQVFLQAGEAAAAESAWSAAPAARRLLISFKGGDPAKNWPPVHYRALLEKLAGSGTWFILLVGSPADEAMGDDLALHLPSVRNLAGRVSLRETLALTATAGRVLCSSTFLLHAAAAFSRPTIVTLGAVFHSAQAEARQWSCNPHARFLGPEPDHPPIATPTEVLGALLALPVASPAPCAIS